MYESLRSCSVDGLAGLTDEEITEMLEDIDSGLYTEDVRTFVNSGLSLEEFEVRHKVWENCGSKRLYSKVDQLLGYLDPDQSLSSYSIAGKIRGWGIYLLKDVQKLQTMRGVDEDLRILVRDHLEDYKLRGAEKCTRDCSFYVLRHTITRKYVTKSGSYSSYLSDAYLYKNEKTAERARLKTYRDDFSFLEVEEVQLEVV